MSVLLILILAGQSLGMESKIGQHSGVQMACASNGALPHSCGSGSHCPAESCTCKLDTEKIRSSFSCKKKDVAITIDTATASGSNTGQILPPFTTLMREPMSTRAAGKNFLFAFASIFNLKNDRLKKDRYICGICVSLLLSQRQPDKVTLVM
ncbi:hypothetical protein PCANC_09972 [Puccinia coronata f. sp. avenae]|uniref:EB domain-containing protein n=1 Tax=Puccinia coronata f. sp. avenae TaxID=200324 RepID=A0A2N5T130_9BASI|nr:hypothetical protein PCANC_09972 [Puccinia coronata f. sp. avenae]